MVEHFLQGIQHTINIMRGTVAHVGNAQDLVLEWSLSSGHSHTLLGQQALKLRGRQAVWAVRRRNGGRSDVVINQQAQAE